MRIVVLTVTYPDGRRMLITGLSREIVKHSWEHTIVRPEALKAKLQCRLEYHECELLERVQAL